MDNVTVTDNDLNTVLANSVMLVAFRTKTWSAETTDSKATGIVKKETGAKGNAGSFRTNMLANNEDLHEKLCKAISAAYRTHLELTRPWGITGYRMLPNCDFEQYVVAMERHNVVIGGLRDLLIAAYPEMKRKSLVDLGDLANEAKYPSADEIGSRYGIQFDFAPTNGRSFPGLPPNYAAALQAQLEKQTVSRMQGVIDDQWVRIRKLLERFHDQTSPDGKIYDATVDDVMALPKSIRAFNMTDDAKLEAIATVVEKELCTFTRKTMVAKDHVRALVHAAVGKIVGMLP